jgi:hypothetical protein
LRFVRFVRFFAYLLREIMGKKGGGEYEREGFLPKFQVFIMRYLGAGDGRAYYMYIICCIYRGL